MERKNKKLFKTLLKAVLTATAFYIVFSKIALDVLFTIIKESDLWILFGAFVAFNLSKIVSSVRLNHYFKSIKVQLSELQNLLLYYKGMFYNLFLPGGIGGDGYKIYLLGKNFDANVKSLISASLLDRISGAVPLLFFAGIFFLFSSFVELSSALNVVSVIGTVIIVPLFYLLSRKLFSRFMPVFSITVLLGFVVQVMQVLSAWFIFKALGQDAYAIEFMLLFLVSSLVAILPITIGGAGARELVFLYGLAYLQSDVTAGVAFALLFFIITAISSLIGAFLPNPLGKNA